MTTLLPRTVRLWHGEKGPWSGAVVTISRVSGFGAVLAEISERAAAHNISMHFRHTIRNPIGGCTDHPKCTKINSG